MKALEKLSRSAPALFDPARTKIEIAKADAVMDFAIEIHDWPLLETAVDHKVEEQEEFVRWWREKVSVRYSRNRFNIENVDQGSLSVAQAEKRTKIRQQQVSIWRKRLKDRDQYRQDLFDAAYRKAMAERGQTDQRGASGTGENEWYTPQEHIVAARDVLGRIDLDPASSSAAQEKVGADTYFTEEVDGLKQEWYGRVWLNPPYAQPHIAHFVSKMVAEYRAGRVTAGIMLTHNYTDTSWFHEAASIADAICFTRGRVKFYDATGEIAAPTQGQAFFYFGKEVAAFAKRFQHVGFIMLPFMEI